MWQRLGVLPALLLLFALALAFQPDAPAFAQTASQQNKKKASDLRKQINRGTVGIISGGINGTYIRIASDLASVLDDGNQLRVLPLIGKGSVQNIRDILYLRGIDIGIVQSDVLAFLKQQRPHAKIEDRIHYITKLYNEELHVLVGPGVKSVDDLRGKKVNFGNKGSGTYMTSSIVFQRMGVKVEPTSFDQALAVEKIRNGEIAALVYVVGKPARLFSEADVKGLKLLALPQTPELLEVYLPSRFTSADYPALVPQGQEVRTLAVGAVMAVYNWTPDGERYAKVSRFVDTFFTNFNSFQQAPRHPKWREVNLNTEVPGWNRFKAASDWLEKAKVAQKPTLESSFARFLAEEAPKLGGGDPSLDQAKDELFRQFLLWQAKQQSQ